MDKAPVFVKISEHKHIKELVELTMSKIREARDLLNKIHDLKTREDNELAKWSSELNEVQSSVEDIDSKLVNPDF